MPPMEWLLSSNHLTNASTSFTLFFVYLELYCVIEGIYFWLPRLRGLRLPWSKDDQPFGGTHPVHNMNLDQAAAGIVTTDTSCSELWCELLAQGEKHRDDFPLGRSVDCQ